MPNVTIYFEYRGAFQTTGYVLSALQAARPALEDQVFSKEINSCHMLSSGRFPDLCSLNANVSEHSVCSIFIGE
jgi:hypothetical protein